MHFGTEHTSICLHSAPPTSVTSEQLLSAAAQLHADRCSNLHGNNTEKLLLLAYNIALLWFNY